MTLILYCLNLRQLKGCWFFWGEGGWGAFSPRLDTFNNKTTKFSSGEVLPLKEFNSMGWMEALTLTLFKKVVME